MMRIIDEFFRKDQVAQERKSRLARMLIIDRFFQRRMVQLPATTGYITRDVRAEIGNGRLAMLQIIEKFFREDSGAKIAKDRLARMTIIGMFFQRHRVRLPATLGYITRDFGAEIANGRLAVMDVIGMKLCDLCLKGDGQILGSSRVHVQTDTGWRRRTRTLKHGRISMLGVGYMTRALKHGHISMLALGYMTHEIMRIFRCRGTVELRHGGISLHAAKFVAYCGFCELSTGRNRR